ncbi:hypothetical protein ASG90_19760 [Nocardioides sp. Soil797]|nr:hypothetical protein ASG90_19760 [Nocardioides sp. Soil797]
MKLMRTIFALVVLLVLCLGSAACNETESSDETVTLEVEVVDWNGWDPKDEPRPSTSTIEVSQGSTFEVEVLGGPATFEVTSISDDEVELEADQQFAPVNDEGGSNLNDLEDEFTLDRRGDLEMDTATTDAGTHVTVREA